MQALEVYIDHVNIAAHFDKYNVENYDIVHLRSKYDQSTTKSHFHSAQFIESTI